MKKRVGLREAKHIFHKRPLKNQLRDRQKTSKKLVNPYSKNSYKWKQNPNQYDMRGVDTKTITPKAIKNNTVYTYFGQTNTLNKAQQIQKEILASFSHKTYIKQNEKLDHLKKISNVDVFYKKHKKKYRFFIRPKNKLTFPHPIFSQVKKNGGFFD